MALFSRKQPHEDALEALGEAARKATLEFHEANETMKKAEARWAEAASAEASNEAALEFVARSETEWQAAQREAQKREALAKLATERLEHAQTEAGQRALKAEAARKAEALAELKRTLGARTKAARSVIQAVDDLEKAVATLHALGAELGTLAGQIGFTLDLDGHLINRTALLSLLQDEMYRRSGVAYGWVKAQSLTAKCDIPTMAQRFEAVEANTLAALEARNG